MIMRSVLFGLLALRCSASVPNVRLNNGVQMPVIAFAAQVWDAKTCENATAEALKAGFRFIWSSMLVGPDCQKAQARAIAGAGLARSELFIAGTVNTGSCADAGACHAQTRSLGLGQLELLGTSSVDMLMLDYPASAGCDAIQGQWRALEELYAAGHARTVAVSNFSPEQLRCVLAIASTARPTVNQMPYSVGHGTDTVVSEDSRLGVVVQAYSPLNNGKLAHDTLCSNIGKAHNKSSVQVALRWILQHNVTIATQSTSAKHLADDLAIFNFSLSPKEMQQLDKYSPSSQSEAIFF